MMSHIENPKEEKIILVSQEFVEDITHALGSLAQYFLCHCKEADVTKEEALIIQACKYLKDQGCWEES